MGVLDGKAAIIVGGGRGIGRAVALTFAREGARVLVNDLGCERDGSGSDEAVAGAVADEIATAGGEATPNGDSCTTREGAERIVAAAIERFGRVDTLVYCAGILADQGLLQVDPSALSLVIATHLEGALFATRAAAAAMQRGGGGRIVLTTGAAGLSGNFGQPAYSAAAGGVYGLMRAASIELQRKAIFVNAVAPLAKTRLTSDLPMFAHVDTMTPDHVAPAYLFFGSDLSGDVTGNAMSVAGGRISLYKLAETGGRFKDAESGIWRATEIQREWPAFGKP